MFRFLIFLFFIVHLCLSDKLNDDDVILPNVFELDDYYECQNSGNKHCYVQISLLPLNTSSKSWQQIQKFAKSSNYFDKSRLHHGICVNYTTQKEIEKEIERRYKDKFLHLNLITKVEDIVCTHKEYFFRLKDSLPIIFGTLLVLTTAYASFMDWTSKTENFKTNSNLYLMAFSVFKNWKEVQQTNRKYSCLEGFRTFTMLIILFFHTVARFMSVYLKNTEFIENFVDDNVIIIRLSMYVVQVYLILSAVLNIIRVRDIHENKGEFSARDLILVILNRWCRIWPSLIFLLLFHTSNIPMLVCRGPVEYFLEKEIQNCDKNWWLTLFLLHNVIRKGEMCLSLAWYLAVDTQLYMISIFIAYFALKKKLNLTKVFSVILISAILFNSIWNYIQGYPAAFPAGPRTLCMGHHIEMPMYTSLYTSTHSNIASYTIGILCGNIFYNNKNSSKKSQVLSVLSLLSFVFLPVLSIKLSLLFTDSNVYQAIFSGLSKPLYCTGIALGVYGFLRNHNIWLKKILEWKPVVILGNFTYSTYLFHLGPVMAKVTQIREPIYLDNFIFISNLLRDIFVGYFMGILMWFILEAPFQQLQKLIIPQVKKKSDKSKAK